MSGGDGDAALLALLRHLDRIGYRFVSVTPETHARVIKRADRIRATTTEDALGWSLPFRPGAIDSEVERLLERAGAIEMRGGARVATVRVSSLQDRLFLHSAYPTTGPDSVFFGPDSYRFADLVRRELAAEPVRPGARLVDIGAGSGVGAIVAAAFCRDAEVHVNDINPSALRLAAINAAAAGVRVRAHEADGLDSIDGPIDLAIANPPYIMDEADRTYRHGGAMLGCEVSLRMARAAMPRLAPGGRLILYTGSAIVRGADPLRDALTEAARAQDCRFEYSEIDPDVFGEELDTPAYASVDRIALVAAVITRL